MIIIRKLTHKQEKFVQGLISGLSQRQAYQLAYNAKDWKPGAIDSQACILFQNPIVYKRYYELLDEFKTQALFTRGEAVTRLKWILNKAEDNINDLGINKTNTQAYLKSIQELNKLNDLYPKEVKEMGLEDKVGLLLDKIEGSFNDN